MSSVALIKNNKTCATCDHWDSERRVDIDKIWVQKEIGKCKAETSGTYKNNPIDRNHTCNKWAKWKSIKD